MLGERGRPPLSLVTLSSPWKEGSGPVAVDVGGRRWRKAGAPVGSDSVDSFARMTSGDCGGDANSRESERGTRAL